MTLREEIKAICQGLNYEVTMQSCDEETDQIIKLFEKLIDERMEKTKTIVIALSGTKVWELIEPCYEDLKEELEK